MNGDWKTYFHKPKKCRSHFHSSPENKTGIQFSNFMEQCNVQIKKSFVKKIRVCHMEKSQFINDYPII